MAESATKSPAKKTPSKFGLQVQKTKVIYVFRNADKHHEGVKINVFPGKTFDQFLHDLTTHVGVPTGAVRQLFSKEGKPIKKLDEIEDGKQYVCCGAEKFNKELLPTVLKKEESGAKEEKNTTQDTKTISIYKNGDKDHKGVKVTINSKKFKSFELLKKELTKDVLKTAARNVYTATGKEVKSWDEIVDGERYIVGGPEKFNKDAIPIAFGDSADPPLPSAPTATSSTGNGVPKKEIKKFGTQAETAKVIYVFRNGDKHHQGFKMTLHNTKFKSLDQVKEAMTKQIGVPTGAVLKVVTPEGKPIKSLDEFVNEGRYVCAGAEKLNKDHFPIAIWKKEEETEPVANEPPQPKKDIPNPQKAKNASQADQSARVILVFRNGDKNHEGVKVTIHPTKFKKIEQLKEEMTKKVGVPTGAVRQIFTADGKLVKTLEEFENDGVYICAGAEKLNKSQYPLAIKKLELKKKEEKDSQSKSEKSDSKEDVHEEENTKGDTETSKDEESEEGGGSGANDENLKGEADRESETPPSTEENAETDSTPNEAQNETNGEDTTQDTEPVASTPPAENETEIETANKEAESASAPQDNEGKQANVQENAS